MRKLFILPVLMVIALLAVPPWVAADDPPQADYGDAPDNTYDSTIEAYTGVPGQFPSLFDTTNASIPGNTGPYHENVNAFWLGVDGTTTTVEPDALLVDNDDACVQIWDASGIGLDHSLYISSIHVADGPPSPLSAPTCYVNALVDRNRDGKWDPSEHVIQNHGMWVPPGEHHGLQSAPFSLLADEAVWVRVTLTRGPLTISNWDGSIPSSPGGLGEGETEDWLVLPVHLPVEPPSPCIVGAEIKEPLLNFSFEWIPNPVPMTAGVPKNFSMVITRVRAPAAGMIPATDIEITAFDFWQRIQGSGPAVIVNSISPNVGIMNDGVGLISSVPPHWPAPAAVGGITVIPFTALFPLPPDQRVERASAIFAIDPEGETIEYDYSPTVEFVESIPGGGIIEGGGIDSGSTRAPWALITGGALALMAILMASGWYARKHWLLRRVS